LGKISINHSVSKYGVTFILVSIALLLLVFISLWMGSFQIAFEEIISSFIGTNSDTTTTAILWQIRLPRTLMALFAGGILALSGYQMQIVFQNPLADPYLLGVSAGAALGANSALLGFLPLALFGIYLVPVWAGVGALCVTFICIGLGANGQPQGQTLKLLLAGVALSSLCGALNSLLVYLSVEQNKLRSLVFWMLGSLDKATWATLWLVMPSAFTCLAVAILLSNSFKIMLMGEQRANSLGLNTNKLRIIVLVLCSLATAFTVSSVGVIGFVGLVVPQFARAIFPSASKQGIGLVFLLGASLLLLCDILSRCLYQPNGIPIGVISAFTGLPFFLYLLRKNNYRLQ